MKDRIKQIRWVLLVVMLLNLLVAAGKIFVGFVSGSASITADGFHSLSDGTSNLIGLVGIALSSKPVDADHPYGHKKYETLFAMGIAVMLSLVALDILQHAIDRLLHPMNPDITILSFVIMIVTMVINIIVMVYERLQGRKLQSDILVVDSMHTRSDIFTSATVILALLGMRAGWYWLDPVVSILIACFIGFTAYEIMKQESDILCDAAVFEDTTELEKIAKSVSGVLSCHKIRSRGRSDDVHIDLHVEVNGKTTVQKGHQISHEIGKKIMKKYPQVSDVLVHPEPH